MKVIVPVLLVLALLVLPLVGSAEVPKTINYQGLVSDKDTGQPLSGTVDLTFSLYIEGDCADTLATPLWSEVHSGVGVTNGIYSVVLGGATPPSPLTLAFDQPYCLGVAIGGEEVLPRQKLTAVPYALRANDSEMVGGHKIADLDTRYGKATPLQNPRTNAVATIDSEEDLGQHLSITIGTDGLPIISYYDSTNFDLKVAKCGNVTCTSGNTVTTVDSEGDVGTYTSITVGTDGLPVISYYDSTNFDLKVAKCGNAFCSSGNTIATVDTGGDVGQYTSITVGTDGLPIISYYDNTNFDLKVAKCGNASCSSVSTITTVDNSANDVGRHTSISIGTDGFPVISYQDNSFLDLKVAKCGNASCSSGNTIATVIDPAFDAGKYSSIVTGMDGRPIISYYDYTNGRLKVVKCGNASCSSGNTITTPDSGGGVGQYTSITIGKDELPVISYYDNTNFDLKVVKCSNVSCSSGNTITTLDSEGDVGQYTSITIGYDGLPIIAYYDVTNGDLKTVKCANQLCLNNWTRR